MIILTNLAALIYLIQREHLIRMGEKFGTKGYHNSKFTKDGEKLNRYMYAKIAG